MISIDNSSASPLLQGLNKSQNQQQTAFERLSSGKQINKAADNAAALAVINQFSAQITGSSQAIRNANDGISLTQIADSSLQSVTDSTQRIRELSIQSANGILSDQARNSLQTEVAALQEDISSAIDASRFGSIELLATDNTINVQVGPNDGDQIEAITSDISPDIAALLAVDISSQSGANDALAIADSALDSVASKQADFGALASRFESAISNLESSRINNAQARSRLADTDFGSEASALVQARIQQQSGIAVQTQANSNAQLVLSLLS
ncbi:MAG: flagellin [Oceanicoccus sp.]